MAYKVRSATVFDLPGILKGRRRQRVLTLNPPYNLVQPDSPLTDLLKPIAPVKRQSVYVYVYIERGVLLGHIQAQCNWDKREEWTITALASIERIQERVWQALLEEVSRAAGEAGAMRLYVKIASEDPRIQLFHRAGFTHYTNERIWGNLYFSASRKEEDASRKLLRRQGRADAWDVMQLYSAVTPPAVQRAESLTSRQWQTSNMPRPPFFSRGPIARPYVWPNEAGEHGLGGYIKLLTGARGHWITLLYRTDALNREVCPAALDHVLWKAARAGNKPVYCGVREYQVEVESLLESRGFHPLSEQALMVKYLAVPVKESRPALVPFLAQKRKELVATKFFAR